MRLRPFPGKGPLLAGLLAMANWSADAREISVSDLAGLSADVILLGEIHDNPDHHLNQAAAIAGLRPSALVFEMFGPDAALSVTPQIMTDPAALAQALDWDSRGWPDFAMYHPIFLAAPDAAIFGGALPRGTVRQAVLDGAAPVMGASAQLFGLDAALASDELASRIDLQRRSHCNALPEDMLPGMVEAQRLRDAALARAVIAAMAETGPPVVVIAGNGHVRRDWGVPAKLDLAMPGLQMLSVGQFEATPDDEAPPYDFWLVAAPPERGDPCDVFRQ